MWWNPFKNSNPFSLKPIFDAAAWQRKVASPRWFLDIPAVIEAIDKLYKTDPVTAEQIFEDVVSHFESWLAADAVVLARTGQHHDAERRPIDTIVIHHSHMKSGLTPERISAINLYRLYAPRYATKEPEHDIYSGHFRYGVQVFWPYHWIVRTNGTVERLLNDKETGWHAGDWDVNCRSVAIVLDGDFENGTPSDTELKAVARIIKEQYPHVPKENILGHLEVNKKTTCPSKLFLSEGSRVGWKDKLLGYI